jgi:hypothetical protein
MKEEAKFLLGFLLFGTFALVSIWGLGSAETAWKCTLQTGQSGLMDNPMVCRAIGVAWSIDTGLLLGSFFVMFFWWVFLAGRSLHPGG